LAAATAKLRVAQPGFSTDPLAASGRRGDAGGAVQPASSTVTAMVVYQQWRRSAWHREVKDSQIVGMLCIE
jgi:hypothetical protein